MSAIVIFCSVYFALVAVVILQKRTQVRNQWFQMFRFFFPSWRFFEDLGFVPILSIRFGNSERKLGEWIQFPNTFSMGPMNLFFNPRGTFALAFRSHLAQLANEINEIENSREVEKLTSYMMTLRFANGECQSRKLVFFQFRLLASVPDLASQSSQVEEILVSKIYKADPSEY